MSSNVELLMRAFSGWGRGDATSIAEITDDESVVVAPDSMPYGGVYRGAQAIADWFAIDIWHWFDEFGSTWLRVIDAGSDVVVVVRVEATAKNGRSMDIENVWVYTVENGVLRHGRVYADTAVINETVAGIDPPVLDPATGPRSDPLDAVGIVDAHRSTGPRRGDELWT